MARRRKPDLRRNRGDAHSPRKPLWLPLDEYTALLALAERQGQPLRDVGRAAIRAALESAGLWPPPADTPSPTSPADQVGPDGAPSP